jgi:hypothetical protein
LPLQIECRMRNATCKMKDATRRSAFLERPVRRVDGAVSLLSSGFQSAAIPFRKMRHFPSAAYFATDAIVIDGIGTPVPTIRTTFSTRGGLVRGMANKMSAPLIERQWAERSAD